MRMFSSMLTALAVMNGVFHTTLAEESALDTSKEKTKSAQEYMVECHVAGKGKSISFTIPKINVVDGVKKSISDVHPKSFVMGVNSDDANTPIKRDATAGTLIEVTVIGNGNNAAILDFSMEMSGHPVYKDDKKGQIRWVTEKSRVIENVTSGKKTVACFEGFDLEIVVEPIIETASKTTLETTKTLSSSNQSLPNRRRR